MTDQRAALFSICVSPRASSVHRATYNISFSLLSFAPSYANLPFAVFFSGELTVRILTYLRSAESAAEIVDRADVKFPTSQTYCADTALNIQNECYAAS